MSILINKQLQRPDKGTLSAGSVIDFNTKIVSETKTVVYFLRHWFNQLAKETAAEDGWLPVNGVKNFSYRLAKECNDEEWEQLNGPGSPELVQEWLKEIIDSKIGVGYTEIV
jgi:hypothetical protein